MLSQIVQQMFWANSVLLDWFDIRRNSSEDLLRLASHILNAETVWIRRAQESDYDKDTFKVHEIAKLREINEENHREFMTLLESDVKRAVDYRLIEGTPGRSSIETIIVHAFSHGFHHRGQMAAMASRNGGKIPNVSYVQFDLNRSMWL